MQRAPDRSIGSKLSPQNVEHVVNVHVERFQRHLDCGSNNSNQRKAHI